RKLAEENHVDFSKVTATGPDGRITKEDITAYLEKGKSAGPATEKGLDTVTTKQPISGMRKIIALRMTESKRNIPHTYFKTSIDATRMIRARNDSGKRYSYNDLIIQAIAHAISEYPVVNALFVNEEIEFRNEINIGLAVEVEDGLVVPVIKNALRPLAEIAADSAALIEKAKNNKLLPDDLAGGTFTISNLGMYAIDEFTAIINPGESAILAVSRIMERVYPAYGQVKIRSEMNLTLSVDHRLIDGAAAARFLDRLKDILELGPGEY
ncbi:MAG: 2-oxo acid dehydrogenase subunit E2, partial [Bacteroidales bacterium]|nr:2-oxo acid dehydrogenase subunit E2 [Bacteroidales bacterium]